MRVWKLATNAKFQLNISKITPAKPKNKETWGENTIITINFVLMLVPAVAFNQMSDFGVFWHNFCRDNVEILSLSVTSIQLINHQMCKHWLEKLTGMWPSG